MEKDYCFKEGDTTASDKATEARRAKAKERREAFCRTYVSNGYNATDAYLAVFRTNNIQTARSKSAQIMKEPEVIARIDELIKENYESLHINAERIAEKLAEIAFAQKGDEVYNTQSVLKALDMLQKQLGLQKQQVKQEVEQTNIIKVEVEE